MPSFLEKPTLQWPIVPPLFWLAVAGTGLALLSLLFREEVWGQHPAAGRWSWGALVLGVAASSLQVLMCLWHWPVAAHYAGPKLYWPIIQFIRITIFVGITLFFITLFILLMVLISL